mmetsp:Transcript_17963/g.27802  ORF Transcript_17963/g.27802 Transcript_17963/m.27802 type:complete len:244 (-) Transcript_17963:1175-1906(-)|eukprot:CAMPEP_0184301650 /NCGR_PEP_ID=MMETSP1049-20130417/11801_1 /TAXON_ID=77928 /ORGANISM="Proteomonas sulcata, Strain CCMP704" /LENGTH=243 /DNA_ID=CAMNT_0026612707 /DNA_START=104 /DNA_END=835 /DNA_ORIENTATION=-
MFSSSAPQLLMATALALSLPMAQCYTSSAPQLLGSSAPRALSSSAPRVLRSAKLGLRMQGNEDSDLAFAGLKSDDYLAFGLAKCFTVSEAGVDDIWVVEPLTGSTLECIAKQVPTAYKRVVAVTAGEVLEGGLETPSGVNLEALTQLWENLDEDIEEAHMCDDAVERTMAAGRTMRRRPESQILPLHKVSEEYNFDPLANRRVINEKVEVNDDDNIKQDMSIDVYGRKDEESSPLNQNLDQMV